MQAYQFHIQPEVHIFSPQDNFFDLSGFVQAIRIKKDVNTPVATMQVTLNPARDGSLKDNVTHNSVINFLHKKIKLQSVITGKIDENNKKHTFLGFVDHKYESIYSFANSTQRTLVLNCSLLLPKLLLRDNIVNAPVLSTNEKIKKELGERTQFFGWMRGLTPEGKSPFAGKPEDAVKWILDNIPSTNTNMGNDLKPKTFFDPKKKDIDGKSLLDFNFLTGEFLFSPQLARFSGPILNYIYSCIDQAFYEVYFDTTTGEDGLAYNTMVIRPKPFSFKNYTSPVTSKVIDKWLYFEDLPEIKINKEIRLQENLGINDYELKNLFTLNFLNSLIGSASSYLGKFGLQFPVVNIESIKRFGLRDLTLTSTLINIGRVIEQYNGKIKDGGKPIDAITAGEDNNLLQYLLEKREKVVEWFAFPYFDSGQLMVVGNENYTIGQRLFYEDKEYFYEDTDTVYQGMHYYINNVFHDFSFGSFFKTTLGLSRGTPTDLAAEWLNTNRPKMVSINKFDNPAEPEAMSIIKPEIYQEVNEVFGEIGLVEEMR